jgi:hypothetical protein
MPCAKGKHGFRYLGHVDKKPKAVSRCAGHLAPHCGPKPARAVLRREAGGPAAGHDFQAQRACGAQPNVGSAASLRWVLAPYRPPTRNGLRRILGSPGLNGPPRERGRARTPCWVARAAQASPLAHRFVFFLLSPEADSVVYSQSTMPPEAQSCRNLVSPERHAVAWSADQFSSGRRIARGLTLVAGKQPQQPTVDGSTIIHQPTESRIDLVIFAGLLSRIHLSSHRSPSTQFDYPQSR